MPVDLTVANTLIKAEIKDSTGIKIGSFTSVLPQQSGTSIPGFFDLSLSPAASLALPVSATHAWDVSITYPGGDRFYYCEGPLEVKETVSRHD